jgi:hypothetical protein
MSPFPIGAGPNPDDREYVNEEFAICLCGTREYEGKPGAGQGKIGRPGLPPCADPTRQRSVSCLGRSRYFDNVSDRESACRRIHDGRAGGCGENYQQRDNGNLRGSPHHGSARARRSASRSTRLPLSTICEMRLVFVMSSSGLASRTRKSACLPAVRVPVSARRR